ncbi:MAG: FAD binding domain-containing protein [Pseudomonadota bacterium]
MVSVESYANAREAAAALTPTARYLGGGTLLMRAVNYGDQSFDRLVRSPDPALRMIQREGDGVVIGAGVRMVDVINHADTAFLSAAARGVGGPAVRNAATVGGNLLAPHPYGDFATALLAMEASVHMADGTAHPVEAFLAARDSMPGLITHVRVPVSQASRLLFMKVSRVKPKGVSLLSIAASVPRGGSRLSGVRLAFGAMGPTPLRAKAAEAALEGANLDEAGLAPALSVVNEGLAPADDALASAWYRREVAPVYLKRMLLEARGW